METMTLANSKITHIYSSKLFTLQSNRKLLINELTELAKVHIDYGQTVVDTINQRLNEVLIENYY